MKLTYPTSNEARGILSSFANQNHSRSTSLEEFCTYCILCYEKKHNLSFVTFVFTNALVDMCPNMNVDNENFVHSSTVLKNGSASSESIDSFFINCIGEKLETFIEKLFEEEQSFTVQISNSGASMYNPFGLITRTNSFIHCYLHMKNSNNVRVCYF
jgi:hypothetical protein